MLAMMLAKAELPDADLARVMRDLLPAMTGVARLGSLRDCSKMP
jgi:hypothetical protein